ncbi:MAG: hypothetical protein WC438_03360 [Candidatus Pacearchaeota archaeon]
MSLKDIIKKTVIPCAITATASIAICGSLSQYYMNRMAELIRESDRYKIPNPIVIHNPGKNTILECTSIQGIPIQYTLESSDSDKLVYQPTKQILTK